MGSPYTGLCRKPLLSQILSSGRSKSENSFSSLIFRKQRGMRFFFFLCFIKFMSGTWFLNYKCFHVRIEEKENIFLVREVEKTNKLLVDSLLSGKYHIIIIIEPKCYIYSLKKCHWNISTTITTWYCWCMCCKYWLKI